MDGKETYVGIFDMPSYTDVLRHIAEKHGEEGLSIVKNPDEMPTFWHEFQHLSGESNHDHINGHKESLDRISKLVELLGDGDEEILQSFIEEAKSEVTSKEFKEVKEYMEGLQ
jgi:hypothetical protein